MTARVLIITDHMEDSPELFDAVRSRADKGDCTFRLLVTNPARAEFHLVHADRHDAVEQAQPALTSLVQRLESEVARPVIGEVSIRHDPFEAVEEDLLGRPADEIIVCVREHSLAHRLHHDLPARLAHLHLPMTVVGSPAAVAQG